MPERKPITTLHYYEIEEERNSESALVLFVRHTKTNSKVVMKILREIKDMRYSLMTIDERQNCQLEALYWNRKFTLEVFVGLAQIFKLEQQKSIVVGDIIEYPSKDVLLQEADYALVMIRLPDDRRLDQLLGKICVLAEEEQANEFRSLLQDLTEYVVEMHRKILLSSTLYDSDTNWGSFEQLHSKLEENIAFLNSALAKRNKDASSHHSWLQNKDSLLQILMHEKLLETFQQRVQMKCIRRCHGDLKSPNIWVIPLNRDNEQGERKYIQVLDAIDFNASFCNIDILSDFAMLVVDVRVRTKSSRWASFMIEKYLQLSKQQDEVSKAVLSYYLVEKAIVNAAVSIDDNKHSVSGEDYLDVAEIYLKDLKDRFVF